MVTRRDNIWRSLDWVTICVYLILIVFGWFSVCGASYDYGDREFWDFSTRAGKQLVWIICSFGLGFVLLMLEDDIYDMFAYLIYLVLIVLLVVTIFIAPETKGSRSWLVMGPVSLQPAEFAKFTTALALASYMSRLGYRFSRLQDMAVSVAIVALPALIVLMQNETGSALVFSAFFLMFYREGMKGIFLFLGVCAIAFFILVIRYSTVPIVGGHSLGELIVALLIIITPIGMLAVFTRDIKLIKQLIIGNAVLFAVAGPFAYSGVFIQPCQSALTRSVFFRNVDLVAAENFAVQEQCVVSGKNELRPIAGHVVEKIEKCLAKHGMQAGFNFIAEQHGVIRIISEHIAKQLQKSFGALRLKFQRNGTLLTF